MSIFSILTSVLRITILWLASMQTYKKSFYSLVVRAWVAYHFTCERKTKPSICTKHEFRAFYHIKLDSNTNYYIILHAKEKMFLIFSLWSILIHFGLRISILSFYTKSISLVMKKDPDMYPCKDGKAFTINFSSSI